MRISYFFYIVLGSLITLSCYALGGAGNGQGSYGAGNIPQHTDFSQETYNQNFADFPEQQSPYSGSGNASKTTGIDGITYYTGPQGGTAQMYSVQDPSGSQDYVNYYSGSEGGYATKTYTVPSSPNNPYSGNYTSDWSFVAPDGQTYTANKTYNPNEPGTYVMGPQGNSVEKVEYPKQNKNVYYLNPAGSVSRGQITEQYVYDPLTGDLYATYSGRYGNQAFKITDPTTGQVYIVGSNGFLYADKNTTGNTTSINWNYYYNPSQIQK